MANPSWRKKWHLVATVVVILLLGLKAFQHRRLTEQIIGSTRDRLMMQVHEGAAAIDEGVNSIVPVNIAISEEITSGSLALNEDAITARLEKAQDESPLVFGSGLAFVPGIFPGKEKYAPLLVDRNGEQVLVHIEDVYDYTLPEHEFYHRPLKEGPVWQEPHYGEASQAFIANFTTPFYRPGDQGRGEPIGVVFTSMSLDQYQELVGSQKFGATGFGFLLSRKGAFVSHPEALFVKEHKTLSDWVGASTPSLDHLVKAALSGIRSFSARIDPVNGAHQWVFVEPIISTGWVLGVVYDTRHIPGLDRLRQSRWILGFLAITAGALLVSHLYPRPRPQAPLAEA